MERQWLVIGIAGTTCSGKTTLAEKLLSEFPGSIFISQDNYFFPVDSPLHTWVQDLGHINWEIMSSLDMNKMRLDVNNILSQSPSKAALPDKARRVLADSSNSANTSNAISFTNILILEGFLLFNDPVLFSLCNLRYYLTLARDQCWDRRSIRVYDPPDIPGYFDKVVWPEFEKHRNVVLSLDNIKLIDGMKPIDSIVSNVVAEVKSALNHL